MRIPRFWAVVAGLALSMVPLHAEQGGFTSTLPAAQVASSGVASLTEAERSVLNGLVAAEVALARQGDIAGFAGTFSSRRSGEERAASGIDRLSTAEVAELDRLVAAAIASGPVQRYAPKRFTDKDAEVRDRLEVHGEISLTYGRGSGGREFKGGSMSTVVYDRKTGTAFGFSYGQYEGDLFGCYDRRYYDGRYPGGPLATGYHRDLSQPRAPYPVRR